MPSLPPSIRDYHQICAARLTRSETPYPDRWFARATWAFVALGILLRIARYLMNYPLWWDEAFVAVNFIRRDYVDLLRPLDYGQVCPILFLWCELTVVKLLGFTEWSLRLFPLVCATISVVLFRHVTARVVRGLPLLLAVAIFATSFHPIVHAADVKPYASDLMAALVLLAIAVEWSRIPERAGWMWVMAVVAPVALALSHPAIFIAAGNMVGLAPMVAKARELKVKIAYSAFALSTLGGFLILFLVFTRAQAAVNLAAMQAQWFAAFPPLENPFTLIKWLVKVHTGSMFAYPCGGESGASSLTLLLFALGAGVLWYRHRRAIVLVCLAPFGLAMLAAAIRRYPYGGPVAHGSPARVMQYVAPGICLLAGTGAAVLLMLCRDPRHRSRIIWAALISLALVGIIPVAADAFHPYRALHAQRAREFARQFWPEFVRDAESVCLRWDLGMGEWNSTNLNVAVYLCNQMIYSPQRRHPRESCSQPVTADRPLRCVSPLTDPTDTQAASWRDEMKKRYRLTDWRMLAIDMAAPGARSRIEHYCVYEFAPPDGILQAQRQGARSGIARTFPPTLE
jgi:4-amino-4-deoxy-L-arabinose transferase-like glycosyltransferase